MSGHARRRLCAAVLAVAALPAGAFAAGQATLLDAATSEPRAFGYQVGDVVSRAVTLYVPDGLALDEASVPRPGARGQAIELRSVARSDSAEAGGRRLGLVFEYQVFLSPEQARTLETPTFTLRFEGQPRAQALRIDAWPITVAPLLPASVSPRRGLGEWRPDTPPPLIDTTAGRNRLVAYAVAMLALLGYLAHVYVGLPWWLRAHRPFAVAWRRLRGARPAGAALPQREAFTCLHEALNRSAGEVVFEQGIDRFVDAKPRFAPLREDLVTFFLHSRREFFSQGGQGNVDRQWLIAFCRRCRDAERGAA